MRLFSPRLLTLKSRADEPRRSVWSTSKSMRSPRSSTRSMFSVMISRTPSISRCAVLNASRWPLSVPPCSSINRLIIPLNPAHPKLGSAAKSVLLGSNSSKKRFSSVVRNPKGMRWPRFLSATTKKVRPPAEACEAGNSEGESVW